MNRSKRICGVVGETAIRNLAVFLGIEINCTASVCSVICKTTSGNDTAIIEKDSTAKTACDSIYECCVFYSHVI